MVDRSGSVIILFNCVFVGLGGGSMADRLEVSIILFNWTLCVGLGVAWRVMGCVIILDLLLRC